MTRLMVMGCLHGKISKTLERKVKSKDFDAIFFLGDLAGEANLYRIIMRKFSKKQLESEEIVISQEDLFREEYKSGITSMKWLNSLKKPVYLVFGNHDKYKIKFLKESEHGYSKKFKDYDRIISKFKNLKYVHKKNFSLDGLKCAAYGGYVEIDTYLKTNVLEETKKSKKERMKRYKMFEKEIMKTSKPGLDIFMSHYPAYMIFDKIKNKLSGKMNKKHAGCSAYNRMIRKDRPMIFLHAHMHEYQGIKKLHDTHIIAAGAALKNEFAILDINKNRFEVEFY